ncbi:hypothetical protein SB749_20435, partial [Brevibacterium sp. SIMBA_078]|uniref:hypothetical protein n=1 Tax=Brevibacterium sp. SIMBA_078 TaxID=3085816 RepID=UPI00397D8472
WRGGCANTAAGVSINRIVFLSLFRAADVDCSAIAREFRRMPSCVARALHPHRTGTAAPPAVS